MRLAAHERRREEVPWGIERPVFSLWEHGPPYIDTYSATKANGVIRVFLCFFEQPGDDPIFVLFDANAGHAPGSWRDVVAPGQLGETLETWRRSALRALGRA